MAVLPKAQLLSSKLVSQILLLPNSVAVEEVQEISTTSRSVLSSHSMKNLSVNQHRKRGWRRELYGTSGVEGRGTGWPVDQIHLARTQQALKTVMTTVEVDFSAVSAWTLSDDKPYLFLYHPMYLRSSKSTSPSGFMWRINNEQACKRASLMPAISLLLRTIAAFFLPRYDEIWGGKRHCILRRSSVFGFELFYEWEKLGTSGSIWLADPDFSSWWTLWISSFVSEDTAIAMVIPQTFYITRVCILLPSWLSLCWMGWDGNLVAVGWWREKYIIEVGRQRPYKFVKPLMSSAA